MRKLLIVLVVVVATLTASLTALATFGVQRDLDIGTVALSIEPGREGALDLYVPVVDWGVRFPVVRLPARIHVDVRSVDRKAVVALADSGSLDAGAIREQATDALAGYLRLVIVVVPLAGLAFGVLVALAIRGGAGPRLRATLAAAGLTALAGAALLAALLPPRSSVDAPQYYANGPEVPTALRALESLGASARTLDDEIDEQLVGIARLVTAPAGREPLERSPRLTVASDLHNNVIALRALEGAARGGPLLFAGDLTDSGSPVESELVLRIVRAGRQLVFVAGNHDSDVLERKLARAGAIILRRDGSLRRGRPDGPVVVRVGGLRIAGYDDPLKRLARDRYRDNGATPSAADQAAFDAWLEAIQERVDIVMVHAPVLAQLAIERLTEQPPRRPLVIAWGHTHRPQLRVVSPTLTLLNPGSVGAGGTGNLADDGGDIGLARLVYRRAPRFEPLAADLVEIDPGDGEARAERVRLGAR